MDYHGQRFLRTQQFISRARELNIRWLDERELEFYERTCLLLPSARTVEPQRFARAIAQQEYGLKVESPADLEPPAEWQRIVESRSDVEELLDRELGTNPCIIKPTCETFEPWQSRDIEITLQDGSTLKVSTVVSYYDYWQVHVVELLRRWRFAERDPLLRELPADHWLQSAYSVPPNTESVRGLNGMAPGYEALTRFGESYARIVQAAREGLRSNDELPAEAVKCSEAAVVDHARGAVARGLDEAIFFGFVVKLFDMMEGYRRDERMALANDVERDVWLAQTFAHYAYGHDWAAFARAVERQGGPQRGTAVRQMDPVEAARDEAQNNLKYILQAGVGVATSPSETTALPSDLAEFCVQDGLFEILKGIESYSFTTTDIRADRYPWFLYRRLRPIAFAVEQLVRGILEQAQRPQRGSTMAQLFKELGRGMPWDSELNRLIDAGYTTDRTTPLEQQAKAIQDMARPNDSEHVTIARTFVLAIVARNLVSHRHRVVPDATVRALSGACGRALVITWLVARRTRLV